MQNKFDANKIRPKKATVLVLGDRELEVRTVYGMPTSERIVLESLQKEEANLHDIPAKENRPLTGEEVDRVSEVGWLIFKSFVPDITRQEVNDISQREVKAVFKWIGELTVAESKEENEEPPTSGNSDETSSS